jgi:hypothetical protein
MATATEGGRGSKKSAAKGAAKRAAKNSAGNGAAEGDDFTAGGENPNRKPETVGVPARNKGQTGELFADRKIPDLHRAALDYVAVRDERMNLTERESAAKDKVIELMKKHKRENYECEGVRIVFEHVEEDKLKVKVKREGDEGD